MEGTLEGPVEKVTLPFAQPSELENSRPVADLFHAGPPQVIFELGVADQNDGELSAAFHDEFDETFERGQRLGVQGVGVVDE